MEPAKMKTHHGYFPGKQMSAVGTDLPVRLGLAMYNKMCQVKSDLIHFTIVLTLTISRHEKITARTAKEHLQVPGNTYLFQGFNDPYFFD
ncbi:hypothetical protein REI33_001654 [Salmonella enterica]|nr:hypothetical protein [Salmonella enterica]